MSASTALASVATLVERLHNTYPNARYELNWDNPLQLLVATILAAQCTDERVSSPIGGTGVSPVRREEDRRDAGPTSTQDRRDAGPTEIILGRLLSEEFSLHHQTLLPQSWQTALADQFTQPES